MRTLLVILSAACLARAATERARRAAAARIGTGGGTRPSATEIMECPR